MVRYEELKYVRPFEHKLMRWSKIRESRQKVEFVQNSDGWDLALIHYRAADAKPAQYKHPVILCHGLGSNRLAFDIDPKYSLPLWLVEQGFEVYAIELRGHGLSEKPHQRDKKWNWGYNEYNDHDLPVLIGRVLEISGSDKAHFIGHSMGGILLYSYLATAGSGLKSGITLGSSLNYANLPSYFHGITPLVGITKLFPRVPIYAPALLSAWLSSKFGKAFMDKSLVFPDNISLEIYQKVGGVCLQPVCNKVLLEMANAINGKGMLSSNNERYEDLLKEQGYKIPVLSISGEGDIQCRPNIAKRFGTDHLAYGPSYGHRFAYGHHDLIVGLNAENEVWPDMLNWLQEHDGA